MAKGTGGTTAVTVGRPKGVKVGRAAAPGNFMFSPGRSANITAGFGGTTRPGQGAVRANGTVVGRGGATVGRKKK